MKPSFSRPDITLFSTCKPFAGQTAVFQNNALESWRALGIPVVLIGDDAGTDIAAKRLGAPHVATVRKNEKGTPLISDIFAQGAAHSDTPYIAYVNADIIITPKLWEHLQKAVSLLDQRNAPVFVTGRRRNLPLYDPLDWQTDGWSKLSELDEAYGSWEPDSAIDLFLFSRGLFDSIPDFAIGRMQWDNWLLWKARHEGARIIDISLEAALYHPIHGYSDTSKGWQDITQGPEAVENRKLSDGHGLTLSHAVTDLYQAGRLLPYADHAHKLEEKLAPTPIKELKAGSIYYLRHGTNWTDTQLADFCRTILWRNQKFLSLDCHGHGPREQINDLFGNCRDASDQDLYPFLDAVQAWLNAEFIAQLEQLKNRPIFIWGAGQAGQRAADFLARHQIQVIGFVDKNPILAGTKIAGLEVTLANLDEGLPGFSQSDKPFFIPASLYAREIAQELTEKGYVQGTDFLA